MSCLLPVLQLCNSKREQLLTAAGARCGRGRALCMRLYMSGLVHRVRIYKSIGEAVEESEEHALSMLDRRRRRITFIQPQLG